MTQPQRLSPARGQAAGLGKNNQRGDIAVSTAFPGSLQAIACALGGEVVGRSVLCPGPAHTARDRSLSVTPSPAAPDGFVVTSFCGDDFRACRDHVKVRLGLAAFEPSRLGPSPHRETIRRIDGGDGEVRRRRAALEIWREARDPCGTIVDRYLNSRGLELPHDAAEWCRFNARTPWRGEDGTLEHVPAMIVLFRDVTTDQACGIHRTRLTPDGRKVDRRMFGSVGGAAVKIDADSFVTVGLTIGEGVESALAGRQMGFRPAWSLGSASAIATFPVLPGIQSLSILAEHDDSGANARAVRQCADRWLAAGREVIVLDPLLAGDANDVLQRGRPAHAA